MQLATLDLVIIAFYAIGLFTLAQWISREPAGHTKDSTEYFLASKTLPWWAIGASLIAANISAEQIVGMSGSGFAIGLAIASYEWMAAITLVIVGKWFLPIFLKNQIYTMPQFLEQRYGTRIRTLMAIFWLGLYIFVNLTSILWLGSIAMAKVAGVDQTMALAGLGLFALVYQLRGGLRAVAMTDIIQVSLLILGGLMVSWLTFNEISHGSHERRVLAGPGPGDGRLAGATCRRRFESRGNRWRQLWNASNLQRVRLGRDRHSGGTLCNMVVTNRTRSCADSLAVRPETKRQHA